MIESVYEIRVELLEGESFTTGTYASKEDAKADLEDIIEEYDGPNVEEIWIREVTLKR